MHPIFIKYSIGVVDEHCNQIMGNNFNSLCNEDKEIFIQEYYEVNELPSFNLVDSDDSWCRLDFCNTCQKYIKSDSKSINHIDHDLQYIDNKKRLEIEYIYKRNHNHFKNIKNIIQFLKAINKHLPVKDIQKEVLNVIEKCKSLDDFQLELAKNYLNQITEKCFIY